MNIHFLKYQVFCRYPANSLTDLRKMRNKAEKTLRNACCYIDVKCETMRFYRETVANADT